MTKRTPGLKRRPQDAYDTPVGAVASLIPHLPRSCNFVEPCAGRGDLVDHLEKFGHRCIAKFDIAPRRSDIQRRSAFCNFSVGSGTLIVTNPPWLREVMHPMIRHLAAIAPTWILCDADWEHTRQSADLLKICKKIVSIGRVRWIEGRPMDGKDNCSWKLFDASYCGPTLFFGRQN